MTIKYFTGDAVSALLRAQLNEDNHTYLLHCCNAKGVMGSGIARVVRERVGWAYVEYKAAIRESRLAGYSPMGTISEGGGVVNLIAQENYGRGKRQVHYGYLSKALYRAAAYCSGTYGEKSTIIIPYKMACDRAGGDWGTVVELIEVVFKDYNVEVWKL